MAAARMARHQAAPVTVAQLTKVRANLPEMESFVDGWLRRGIWPNVVGYSHRAGQYPERAVMSMAPAGSCSVPPLADPLDGAG